MSATDQQTFPELGAEFTIDVPYQTRPVRFIRNADVGDWRLKVYGIARPGHEPRPELVDAALALARDVYPEPARGDDRHGLGFFVVHDSRTFGIVLYYWWQSTNELHQRVFLSPLDDVTALQPYEGPQAAGCVWEMAAIDYERRAWIEDILANPSGPDVERYLDRHFDGDV